GRDILLGGVVLVLDLQGVLRTAGGETALVVDDFLADLVPLLGQPTLPCGASAPRDRGTKGEDSSLWLDWLCCVLFGSARGVVEQQRRHRRTGDYPGIHQTPPLSKTPSGRRLRWTLGVNPVTGYRVRWLLDEAQSFRATAS